GGRFVEDADSVDAGMLPGLRIGVEAHAPPGPVLGLGRARVRVLLADHAGVNVGFVMSPQSGAHALREALAGPQALRGVVYGPPELAPLRARHLPRADVRLTHLQE